MPSDNNTCIFHKVEYCPKEFPYLNSETNECVQNCSVSDLFDKKCIIDNRDLEMQQNIFNRISRAIISRNLDALLNNAIKNGVDLLINEEDIKYVITTTKNQKKVEYNHDNNNISIIDLSDCENILKKYYNLNENDSLIIFKMDIYQKGLSFPFVIYEVYHPKTKEKLDLEQCQDAKINLTLPVQIDEKNAFKHDPKNNFYKDLCYAYTTENGTDITIEDRKKEFIDKNLSLCEDNCDYKGYDTRNKKAICYCSVKVKVPLLSEIEIDKEKLREKFFEVKSIINLELMKCFWALLSKDGLTENVGNYILLIIIFIFFLFYNLFYLIEYDQIINKINEIISIKVKNKERDTEKDNKGLDNNNDSNKSRFKEQVDTKDKKIDKKKRGGKKVKKILKDTSSQLELNTYINKSNIISNKITLGSKNETINNIIILFNDFELNSMEFDEALKFDQRAFSSIMFLY